MSIEQENFEDENIESSLEQYGVWVKKSPAESPVEESADFDEVTMEDTSKVMDINDEDLDTSSIEIFSEDEGGFDEDFGSDFDIEFDDDTQMSTQIEDDSDDTTLTTDELLNITSGMNNEENIVEESNDNDSNDDFDIDFDSFMEDTPLTSEEQTDINSDDNDAVDSLASTDFDLMHEDHSSADSSVSMSDDISETDDLDISFDDFTEESVAIDSEITIETEPQTEASFDSMDDIEESEIVFDSDDDNSPIDFGEEISLDDIPSSSENISVMNSIEETKAEAQDYNISIEPDAEVEKDVITTTSSPELPETKDVLSQIVSELSNLRNEMSQFKSELAKIKTDKASAPAKQEAEEGGFFADYEGDDTIALSGDELNNILTSADFTVDDEDVVETSEEITLPTENESIEESVQDETFEEDSFNIDFEDESIEETISMENPAISETQEESFDISFDDEDASMSDDTLVVNEESEDFSESFGEDVVEASFEQTAEEDIDTTESVEVDSDPFSLNDESFEIDDLDDNYFTSEANSLIIEDKELVEPSLDNIDFDIDSDDGLPEEIDVPVIEDLVVDSSPVNFFDDEEEEQKELDDSAMQYLQDEPAEEGEAETDIFEETINEDIIIDEMDDNEESDEIEIDESLSSEIKDSEIIESYSEPDSNSPLSSVFKSEQWQSPVSEEEDEDFTVEQSNIDTNLQEEIKSVLSYMDRLLESLPEEKISEFAQSEYFGRYKKLFSDLGIS